MRILFVDDSPSSIFLFREALRDPTLPHVELMLAYDGDTAIDIVRRHAGAPAEARPHLVVLDLAMPKMNGLELLRAIRADATLRYTNVFIFSASDRSEDVRAAYDLGANAYLVKSADAQQFLDQVRRAILFWDLVKSPPRERDLPAATSV